MSDRLVRVSLRAWPAKRERSHSRVARVEISERSVRRERWTVAALARREARGSTFHIPRFRFRQICGSKGSKGRFLKVKGHVDRRLIAGRDVFERRRDIHLLGAARRTRREETAIRTTRSWRRRSNDTRSGSCDCHLRPRVSVLCRKRVGKHPPSKTQNASASSLARDAHLASAFAERPARATEEIFFKASTCGSARGVKDAKVRIRAFGGDGLR